MQAIEVVVGGQYGSEAKGHVTAQLVKEALRGSAFPGAQVINIRVAGPNAGHTVYDEAGNEFKLRSIPVGAAISDDAICYIAPGSEVELPVLLSELDRLRQHGHNPTVLVSGQATLLEERHKEVEADVELAQRIGSTAKGIGAARADRLMRSASRVKDSEYALELLTRYGVSLAEPRDLYSSEGGTPFDQHIIVEGTQGYGLGLHQDAYPKVTSSDCTALDFLAMAQLVPWRLSVSAFLVWVVARAYPIRVAGDSGPMKGETSWAELGLPEEHTTVTGNVRRVAMWDGDLVAEAVRANGGPGAVLLALTMADQLIPGVRGFDASERAAREVHPEDLQALGRWVEDIQEQVGAAVGAVTTSPTTIAWTAGQR